MKSAIIVTMALTGAGAFHVGPSITSSPIIRPRLQPLRETLDDVQSPIKDFPIFLHGQLVPSGNESYQIFAQNKVSNRGMYKRKIILVPPSAKTSQIKVRSSPPRPSHPQRKSRRVGNDVQKVPTKSPPVVVDAHSFKSAKDAYLAFAEKGASNAKMSKRKILHQSILGGCYVGFGGMLSLSVAGNMGGVAAANAGLAKMMFAALFPVNLLLILTTGGQLFTGNTASVAAAKFEGNVEWRELYKSWSVSLLGNAIGCSLFALAAQYAGLLTGGTANLCTSMAISKCSAAFGPTVMKAILCNWMVSLAVFLAGASNSLGGKMIGIWFPISTFVAIGLEHSVANLFIMSTATLLKVPLSFGTIVFRNLIPAIIGNVIAGALIVAGSYSYQFGKLGRNTVQGSAETPNGQTMSKSFRESRASP